MGELICNGTTVTQLIYNGTTIAQQGVIQSTYDSYVSTHSYTNSQYSSYGSSQYDSGYNTGYNAGKAAGSTTYTYKSGNCTGYTNINCGWTPYRVLCIKTPASGSSQAFFYDASYSTTTYVNLTTSGTVRSSITSSSAF